MNIFMQSTLCAMVDFISVQRYEKYLIYANFLTIIFGNGFIRHRRRRWSRVGSCNRS